MKKIIVRVRVTYLYIKRHYKTKTLLSYDNDSVLIKRRKKMSSQSTSMKIYLFSHFYNYAIRVAQCDSIANMTQMTLRISKKGQNIKNKNYKINATKNNTSRKHISIKNIHKNFIGYTILSTEIHLCDRRTGQFFQLPYLA